MTNDPFDFVFNADAWLDACESSGAILYPPAEDVATAILALMDDSGSVLTARVIDWLEAAPEMLDGDPASVVFAEGARALVAAHLLLDLGGRVAAVMPTILTAPQEV